MSTETESLMAFFEEHRRCSRLETGIEAGRYWVTRDGCGAEVSLGRRR